MISQKETQELCYPHPLYSPPQTRTQKPDSMSQPTKSKTDTADVLLNLDDFQCEIWKNTNI